MSEENKTIYEVQKILSDTIKSALATYIGENHGFGVMEFAQASFQNADKVVLMNFLSGPRLGWQWDSYVDMGGELKRKDAWIECQRWQFHVILKKDAEPTLDTMQAYDIADILIAWFNGKGCEELRKFGVANERIKQGDIIVYNDDSELYQKRAVFTVNLQVPKELMVGEVEMEGILPKIKPV